MPRLAPPAALALAALCLSLTGPVALRAADDPAPTSTVTATAAQDAPLAIELRLPPGGVHAGAEVELPLRLTEKGENPSGIPHARIKAAVAMPSAPDVRVKDAQVREGNVSGDYILAANFPRAGEYIITFTVSASGSDSGGSPSFTLTAPVTVTEAAADSKDGKNAEEKQAESPYKLRLELDPARPLASEGVKMTFTITDPATNKPVTEYDDFDGKPLQLFIVREDLGDMRVEVPKWDDQKHAFVLNTGLAGAGDWKLFLVTAPRGAGAQVLRASVHVDGVRELRAPLMPQMTPQVRQNGYLLAMKPTRLFARTTTPLEFNLSDTRAGDVTDLDLTGGTLAHLTLVDKDGKIFLHSHTDTSDPRTGRTGTLIFPVRFPKSGVYRGWVQFSRGGISNIMPFVIRVSDPK